jgi:hypothetical protein
MKKVKFLKPYPPYKAGDIATFNEKEAEEILKKEVAESFGEVKAEVKPVEKAEAKAISSPPADKMVKSPKIKK